MNLSNFKKIVNICIKNGWLDRNPFAGFKMAKREVERPFLVEEELKRITEKTFRGFILHYFIVDSKSPTFSNTVFVKFDILIVQSYDSEELWVDTSSPPLGGSA